MFNFSAGPATLPEPVLEQTQADLINYQGSGMSVMEMSHRGPEFTRIIEEAEADLRKLMAIPDNYKVLFLQGGASQQFSAIPFNLTQPDDVVDHVSALHTCLSHHIQVTICGKLPAWSAGLLKPHTDFRAYCSVPCVSHRDAYLQTLAFLQQGRPETQLC